MTLTVDDRKQHAARSLHGLALGDAFGERWFFRRGAERLQELAARTTPDESPWYWTDDTAMGLTLTRALYEWGRVDQDRLALAFATVYTADPHRGYGGAMHGVLEAIENGEGWRDVTSRQFDGQGSFGNGTAMRVAPLGAWFADDLDRAAAEAALSAQVTHAHPEAEAGAVAVAVAAALAVRGRDAQAPRPADFLTEIAERTPPSLVRDGIHEAARLPAHTEVPDVAAALGSGWKVSCPDTVPFALWTAAHHADDLEESLWVTASGLGDIDTTCAITGGVVAARTGLAGVPKAWLAAREVLPAWLDAI